MQPSPNPNPNHRPSPRPCPAFNPSKPFTLSSRPFTVHNRASNHTSINIPPLNLQINQLNSLTHLNALSRLQPRQPVPDVRCQFCNESFKSEEITGHQLECEMQRLSCERCGDRVPMEIYDIHYEECGGMNGNNRMETVELRSPMERRHGHYEMEDDNDDEDEEMSEDHEERTMYLSENALSYEQLLRLDENVVKKGMSEEEMKGFKVQLYVKSLDGEGSCCVCISEFETAEYTRELPCRHKFHKDCIDKWLERSIVCPTCKKWLR